MIYFTAFFFVNKGKEQVFQDYERIVLPLLSKYSGELIYRIQPNEASYISASKEKPYEIHLLSFQSEQDFDLFTKDEVRNKFAYLAKDALRVSFIIKGEEL